MQRAQGRQGIPHLLSRIIASYLSVEDEVDLVLDCIEDRPGVIPALKEEAAFRNVLPQLAAGYFPRYQKHDGAEQSPGSLDSKAKRGTDGCDCWRNMRQISKQFLKQRFAHTDSTK